MRTEIVVSRWRRISPGLAARRRGDEVCVTTRSPLLRAALAVIVAAEVALGLCLWHAGVFADAFLSGILWFVAALLVAPAAVGFYAIPGQKLFACGSGGYVEIQKRWLWLPVRRTRAEAAACHKVTVIMLRREEAVEEPLSITESVLGTALGIMPGADAAFLWLVRRTRRALVPVYAVEIVRRDGSSIMGLFTWSREDCMHAVKLVWDVFPDLEPRPLVDTVGESLAGGERARVKLDGGWARGATGVVADPPDAVARYGARWEGIRRHEGSGPNRVTYYWIRFDEPQAKPGFALPTAAGEFDSRCLERA